MKTYFVTYFTAEFVLLGVVSISRFLKYHPDSSGTAFTFDTYTAEVLKTRFPVSQLTVVNVMEDNEANKNYMRLLLDRNPLESITSLKPYFINRALKEIPEQTQLVYFDPDVMFFGPSISTRNEAFLVFRQKGISEESLARYGRFNAGIVHIRKCQQSSAIVEEWMRLCFQWCKLEVFNNLYADQKYLDYLSLEDGFAHRENFSDNLSARAFSVNLEKIRIKTEVDKILVECERLISYQFHGMRIDKLRIFTGINRFGKLRSKIKLFYLVYLPILGAIRSEMIRLKIDSGVCTSEAGKYDKSRLFENAKREKVFFLTFFYRTYKFLRLSEIPLIFIQFKR